MSAVKKDAEMQSQKMIVQSRNRELFLFLCCLGLLWAGLDLGWVLWLGRLLELCRLLEWGRLLELGQLLGLGCLMKLGYSLKCPPLEWQSALVKAEVSLLPHLIPILGTNSC
jgi:hypothetical protein